MSFIVFIFQILPGCALISQLDTNLREMYRHVITVSFISFRMKRKSGSKKIAQHSFRLLDQRHSEQVRQLGAQLAMDRDHFTAATQRLEKKLEMQQQQESKLRSEMQTLQDVCFLKHFFLNFAIIEV